MRAPGGRSRRDWESLMKLCVRVLGVLLSLFVLTGIGLGTVASVAATTRSGGAPSPAHSARSVSLIETAHLHLTSHRGFTLNEEGSASGTVRGAIFIHLHIGNSHGLVTAEVNIYPHGGSLTGYGSASYRVDGGAALFSGKLSVTRGTGSVRRCTCVGLAVQRARSNAGTTR